ncbi:MAG: CoA transferase [Actinomycetota bacterium]
MLDGLPVLDLTDHRGQFGSWLLAQLGAEVIRVPPARGIDPDAWLHEGRDLADAVYTTGLTLAPLDPTSAADRTTLRELVAAAAIVLDAGPSRRLSAFGVDRTKLVELNPAVVSVVVSPFGLDGPRADQPATELTVAALGGPVRIQGVPERPPVHHSIPQTWRHTGAESVVAALVALARADQTGEAQFVDVSAQSVMTWTMLNAMEASEIQGFDFERTGATLELSLSIPLRHACADGHVILVSRGRNAALLHPWLIEEGIVDPSWADENWDDFDRRVIDGEPTDVSFDELIEALGRLCARYSKRELLERGRALGVTIAPINDVGDLLAFDHLEARGFWSSVPTPSASTDGDAAGPTGSATSVRLPGAYYTVDGERPAVSRQPAVSGDGAPAFTGAASPRPDPTAFDGVRPFDGIVVADFSWIGVGPITAKCLADHGATVVRVESENRIDGLRMQPPFANGEPGPNRSNFYGAFNTSKRSMAVDLKNETGVAVARRLIERADVVIDSFTPGSMARLGLGPDDIAAINPNAITVTTSLLGSGGPFSTMAGYGYHAAAIAGFFDLVGWPDLPPDGPWLAYTDTVAPRFLTSALLAALDRRRRTGRAGHIEAAQLECALQFLAPELLGHQLEGVTPARRGNRARGLAPQGVYPCAGDDCWVAISVVDDEAWSRFRGALGDPGWARGAVLDSVEGRLNNHDAIDTGISTWTVERSEEEVEATLRAAGIAVGRVQRSSDLLADPQYDHRGFYHRLEHTEVGTVPYAGHQYRIDGYDHGPRTAAPGLGEHTFEVLTDLLGYDVDEVAEIAASGCLE